MERINTRQKANMTPEQINTFRMNMRRLRKANHLTRSALSELLECSQVHIGNIERGARQPSDALAKDIAEIFDTTVEEMCLDDSEKHAKELASDGKWLLEKRISRGFKINEVAGFLGTSREAYMDMESGKCNVADSIREALDRLYAIEERVETVEVVKEVPTASPITLETIEKIIPHIAEMSIGKDEQRALFRELSAAKISMQELELFG